MKQIVFKGPVTVAIIGFGEILPDQVLSVPDEIADGLASRPDFQIDEEKVIFDVQEVPAVVEAVSDGDASAESADSEPDSEADTVEDTEPVTETRTRRSRS